MDTDDLIGWAFCLVAVLLSLVLILAFAGAIWNAKLNADAKLACRAAGSLVVSDKDGEWHCAKPTPERAP